MDRLSKFVFPVLLLVFEATALGAAECQGHLLDLSPDVLDQTTEEDGFLIAIRDNPSDEVAMLAYADWLEERGRPTESLVMRGHVDLRRIARSHSLRKQEQRNQSTGMTLGKWVLRGFARDRSAEDERDSALLEKGMGRYTLTRAEARRLRYIPTSLQEASTDLLLLTRLQDLEMMRQLLESPVRFQTLMHELRLGGVIVNGWNAQARDLGAFLIVPISDSTVSVLPLRWDASRTKLEALPFSPHPSWDLTTCEPVFCLLDSTVEIPKFFSSVLFSDKGTKLWSSIRLLRHSHPINVELALLHAMGYGVNLISSGEPFRQVARAEAARQFHRVIGTSLPKDAEDSEREAYLKAVGAIRIVCENAEVFGSIRHDLHPATRDARGRNGLPVGLESLIWDVEALGYRYDAKARTWSAGR